jgi:hypothetical protein
MGVSATTAAVAGRCRPAAEGRCRRAAEVRSHRKAVDRSRSVVAHSPPKAAARILNSAAPSACAHARICADGLRTSAVRGRGAAVSVCILQGWPAGPTVHHRRLPGAGSPPAHPAAAARNSVRPGAARTRRVAAAAGEAVHSPARILRPDNRRRRTAEGPIREPQSEERACENLQMAGMPVQHRECGRWALVATAPAHEGFAMSMLPLLSRELDRAACEPLR